MEVLQAAVCYTHSSIRTAICQHKCVTILGLNLSIWRIIFKLGLKVKMKSITHQGFSFLPLNFLFFPQEIWAREMIVIWGGSGVQRVFLEGVIEY